MVQLTFDLPRRTALSRADFLVSKSNADAIGWIDRWPQWPGRALAVHGPPASGKTHLIHLWCEQASAIIISGALLDEEQVARLAVDSHCRIAVDDADQASELPLLHLYNSCLEPQGGLLLAARRPPAAWPIRLDDLGSRLRAAIAVGIGAPDDMLLGAVLVKHFADRQLRVGPEVIAYLIRHIERSFAAAAEIAAQLDAASLKQGRGVTVPLAREVLAASR